MQQNQQKQFYEININIGSQQLNVQKILYTKINNHLLFHFIPLVQFWKSNRLCINIQQFQSMLFNIDFFKAADQLIQMKEKSIQFISLDKLLQGVNQWKKQNQNIVNFLQKQKQYQNKQLQIRNNQSTNKKTKSKYQNQSNHNRTNTFDSKITQKTTQDKTKQFIAKNIQKQKQALYNLNKNLIKAKNQSHYQLTIKIGQLNDICKKLKNNMTFLLLTKNGETQIIEKSQKSGTQKVISDKVFNKLYQDLKTASNNLIEPIQGTLQKDLRQTLVQVMYLSDQLENQIKLLKRKGINS